MGLRIKLSSESDEASFSDELIDKLENYLIRERDAGGAGSAYDKLEQAARDLVNALDEIEGDSGDAVRSLSLTVEVDGVTG